MKPRDLLLVYGLILLLILFSGCISPQSDSPTTSQITQSSTISIGPRVEVLSQTISPEGGTVSINMPNNSLNGFSIQVLPNAFTQKTTFVVSYSPITQHTLGPNFHPISPLISIESSNNSPNELILIRYPIDVPDDHFVMAFSYNKTSGKLGGLPIIERNVTYITIGTYNLPDFVLSSISMSDLFKTPAESKFSPGVDDWEFNNSGSYVTPEGQCTGMTLSTLWYFNNKKPETHQQLYGLYDNNGRNKTDIWQDDVLAYRLTAIVQQDFSYTRKLMPDYFSQWKTKNDTTTFNIFYYLILTTGKPQLIGVRNSNQNINHSLIVYKAADNQLYIADPNRQGDKNIRISLVDGQFQHYRDFDQYTFQEDIPLVFKDQIGNRWIQLEQQIIGDGIFPSYNLHLVNGNNERTIPGGKNLKEYKFYTNNDTLKISTSFDSSKSSVFPPPSDPKIRLFYYEGGDQDNAPIILKEGDNKIGIYVYTKGKYGPDWVGYDWITINYTKVPPTLTPTPTIAVLSPTIIPTTTTPTPKIPSTSPSTQEKCPPCKISAIRHSKPYYCTNDSLSFSVESSCPSITLILRGSSSSPYGGSTSPYSGAAVTWAGVYTVVASSVPQYPSTCEYKTCAFIVEKREVCDAKEQMKEETGVDMFIYLTDCIYD